MCVCSRNWQANDCSERTCQFGLAHVDSPVGDLDASGSVSSPEEGVVAINSATFPYGTTEQFPLMQDSDMNVLSQSAHAYAECSNKGVCDRKTGTCFCFDGYEGVACQRTECPNLCSGHGVCLDIAQLSGSTYKLWDSHATLGCQCDASYSGPDCSERRCKYGVDPLYLDDTATIKYSIFDVATLTTAPGYSLSAGDKKNYFTSDGVLFNDGTASGRPGHFSIRFFDALGEDWITDPIKAGASCDDVVGALESLPNNVIPAGMTLCTRSWNAGETVQNSWSTTGLSGVVAEAVADTPAAITSATQTLKILSGGSKLTVNMLVRAGFDPTTVYIPLGTYITSVAGLTGNSGDSGSITLSQNMTAAPPRNTALVFYSSASAPLFTASVGSGSTTLIVSTVTYGKLVDGMELFGVNGVAPGTKLSTVGAVAISSQTFTAAAATDNGAAIACANTAGLYVGQTVTVSGFSVYVTHIDANYVVYLSNLVTIAQGGTFTSSAVAVSTSGGVGIYSLSKPALADIARASNAYAFDKSDPLPIFDASYPATSKHPYKINYHLSIWDGYSGDPALQWYPGSFKAGLGLAMPFSAIVYASASSSSLSVQVEQAGASRLTLASPVAQAGDLFFITTAPVPVGYYLTGNAAVAPETYISLIDGAISNKLHLSSPLLAPLATGTKLLAYSEVVTATAAAASTAAIAGATFIKIKAGMCNTLGRFVGWSIVDDNLASFTAAASASTTLTVTNVLRGIIVNGMTLTGLGVSGTVVLSACSITFTSGAWSGTCTMSSSQSITGGDANVYTGQPHSQVIGRSGTNGLSQSDQLTILSVAFGNSVSSGSVIMFTAGSTFYSNVVLSACSLNSGGLGTCTMSQSIQIADGTTIVIADGGYIPTSTVIPRGTIVTSASVGEGGLCSLMLSKPLSAPLPALSFLRLNKFGSFSVGMAFDTPLSRSGGPTTRVVTAVSGPKLGVYTLTYNLPSRNFTEGDVVRSLSGGVLGFQPQQMLKPAVVSGYIYRLSFFGNPGKLPQPEILVNDGSGRPTLMSVNYHNLGFESNYRVMTNVWTDGQQGENVDYVSDHCDGVQVRIARVGGALGGAEEGDGNMAAKTYLTALTDQEKKRLKKCLGDADFDASNNIGDGYSWDKGNAQRFPHLIKLVRSVTTYTDGGYYAALYFSELERQADDETLSGGTFFLLNPFSPPDLFATDNYDVYTTKGVLARVSPSSEAVFSFGDKRVYTVARNVSSFYDGDVSCTRTLKDGDKFDHIFNAKVSAGVGGVNGDWSAAVLGSTNLTLCVDKTDIVTFLNPSSPGMNPPHINLYTVEKTVKKDVRWSNYARYGTGTSTAGDPLLYMTNELHLDLSTNWGSATPSPGSTTMTFYVYKFFPHKLSSYEYVARCSNRGNCNTDTGVCECFGGYSSDNCHVQSVLAM